jgi:Holliday junction resolvasome RuvABC endonuclease subunit
MRAIHDEGFVLAFYPATHGYAFVLFEGPDAPFDWGVVEVRSSDKNGATLDALRKLVAHYHPEVFVIEDGMKSGSRRASRIKRLQQRIEHYAAAEGIDLHRYTRAETQAVFQATGAITKYEIAETIATMIPAFAHRLPRKRKIWMSEDPRQSLFDAAALGITYYMSQSGHLSAGECHDRN